MTILTPHRIAAATTLRELGYPNNKTHLTLLLIFLTKINSMMYHVSVIAHPIKIIVSINQFVLMYNDIYGDYSTVICSPSYPILDLIVLPSYQLGCRL